MPIYEYYCPGNHTIYQFYAKTLAQGRTIPSCPDDPKLPLRKLVSAFAVVSGGKKDESAGTSPAVDAGNPAEDARMEATMGMMEKEFSNVDENDPKAMARMMRKMSEATGEKINGEMEEVVRKLEEGADPDSLEEQLGGDTPGEGDPYGDEMSMGGMGPPPKDLKEARHRFKARRLPPRRDPKLHDYE
ncbi:MAG: FmdB family transcriptional regulator [Opitutus sp.]|nr:FmdB family transcriptional regulator [Opitutus sp.]